MEFLAQDPDFLIVYDFIGDGTIKKIQETLSDESTYYRFGSWESENLFFRRGTGTANWVWDGLGSSFDLLSITKNVEAAFNLRARRSEESEKLYVKSYTWASTSTAHMDTEFVASAMHYLMDVEHGGYTAFPLIGLAVKPVKGAVVLWFNQKRDQTQNSLSTHLSCPVLYGRKQVATKWIKEDANIFTFNCATEKGQQFRVKVNGKEYKRTQKISKRL